MCDRCVTDFKGHTKGAMGYSYSPLFSSPNSSGNRINSLIELTGNDELIQISVPNEFFLDKLLFSLSHDCSINSKHLQNGSFPLLSQMYIHRTADFNNFPIKFLMEFNLCLRVVCYTDLQ
jgi:hypothetical protein